jgi:hypothetical protein
MADLASIAKVIFTAEDKTGAALDAVKNGLDGVHSKAMGLVTGGLAALGAALSVGAFAHAIKDAIDFADTLNDLSKKTGVSVETLGGLGYAAKTAGVDLETIAKGGQKLAMTMSEAQGGSKKAQEALAALGITVNENTTALPSMEEALFAAADAMEEHADGAEKAADAAHVFGKAGAALIPLLDEGSEGLRKMVEDWKKYGGVTADTAARADAFNDTLEKLHLMSGAFMRNLSAALLPALQAIADVLVDAKQNGGGFSQVIDGIVAIVKVAAVGIMFFVETIRSIGIVIGSIAATVAGGFRNVGEINKQTNADLEANWTKTTENISKVWNATATDVAEKTETKIKPAMKGASDKVKEFDSAMEAMKKQVVSANAALDEAADITGEKVSPAMKELLTLVDSDKWAKFNKQQRDALIDKALDADATFHQAEALKEFNKVTIDQSKALLEAEQALAEVGLTADQKMGPAMKKVIEQMQSGAWRGFTDEQVRQKVAVAEATDAITKQAAMMAWYQGIVDSAWQSEDKENAIAQARIDTARRMIEARGDENDKLKDEIASIGLVGVARELHNSQLQREKDLRGETDALIIEAINRTADERDALIALKDQKERTFEGWRDLWSGVAERGASFIEDFVAHGSSAFKNLWQDFKTWALESLAKIAAQQIVVSIAGNFGAPSAAAASSLFGGTGFLGNLLGNGGSNTSAAGPVQPSGIFSAASGVGSMFGGSMGAFGAGLTSPISTIATFATEGLAAAGGVAGILGAAIPVLGIALAAGSLFGLFGKNSPAQRAGTFGSNEGLGAGNPLFRSSSQFGSFGIFDDKWFSDKDQGQAIQQFLAGIAQVDNAIASIIDEPTLARVRANLATATTTFTAGMEHEASTFGDVVKDRYHTVVDAIDPELTHLVDGFKGTSDELGKFVVDILSVRQTLQTFNSEDLFGQIVTVDDIVDLQHAGESVSQTFTRVVSEFTLTNAIAAQMGQNVGTAFGEVGLASEGARADLIKLMGGMNAAASAFQNYLNVAFTDAERQTRSVAAGMQTLNSVFGDLGVAVPHTWEEFNQLVASLDLSTDAGRAAYAMLMTRGVPAMVAVYGSAQDMANASNAAAGANTNAASATNQVATAARSVINPMMGVVQAITQLRSAADIAATHVNALTDQNDTVAGFVGGSDSGTKLSNRLSLITGEIHDLEEQLARYQPGGDLASTDNAYGEVATLLKSIGPLKTAQDDVAAALAHFTTLSAQYGNAAANQLYDLEQNYKEAQGKVAGNATALGLLFASYKAQRDQIIDGARETLGSLTETTQAVVAHVITPLEAAISGLHTAFANDSVLTDAVKWLNGVDATPPSSKGDDWTANLNNALPDGKLASQADIAAFARIAGQLLDEIRQNTSKGAAAASDTALAVAGNQPVRA